MSIRITIVNNSNQSQKVTTIIPHPPSFTALQTLAKNKLKFKKPIRFFFSQSKSITELNPDEDEYYFIQNDAIVYVSAGEDYIGKDKLKRLSSQSLSGGETFSPRVEYLHQSAAVEQLAIEQLERTSKLPGMKYCIGMPDLHPGLDSPIGAAFGVKSLIYPRLIGGDIGCGMSMFKLTIRKSKIEGNEQKIAKSWDLEGPWIGGDLQRFLFESNLKSSEFDGSLGTIGRGNHFAEIQVVEEVVDRDLFLSSGFDENFGYLLVHSGSRGLGKSILEKYSKYESLKDGSSEFDLYLGEHDEACRWARKNRELIAKKTFDCLGLEQSQEKMIDIWHNNVELIEMKSGNESIYLHRKGAAPSNQGIIPIPGSRGTYTYIVQPTGSQERNGYSVAHGAGRELSRSEAARGKVGNKNSKDLIGSLKGNDFGGVVICEDEQLLFEEAPAAYKDIDLVVKDLVDRGIVRVIAKLKPMITYKTR